VRTKHTWRWSVLALVTAVVGAALTVPVGGDAAWADTAPPATDRPATVSADPLPTWQVTGVVWSQVTVGTTVYATGSFTKARPPGMWKGGPTEIDVAHLIAYDITTGQRIASFNHTLDAQGLAITASPDGSRVYVGGDFTTVDGVSRPHLAAFDTRSGALVPDFAASVNGQVKALTATNSTLYAGGGFTGAGPDDDRRYFLASFSASTGALTSWAPVASGGYTWALTMTPDKTKVIAGGQFSTLNGATVNGMGALDATTGATLTWRANTVIKDYNQGAIDTLTTDGTLVYGGGFAFGAGGTFEGSFALDPADGSIRWLVDCLGDTYDVEPVGPVLYVAGHPHDCTMVGGFTDTSPRSRWQYGTAFTTAPVGTNAGPNAVGRSFKGQPAAALLHWYPTLGMGVATGQYQSAWSVTSAAGYVALGGEFPTVAGKPQQGLTRYATAPVAPNRSGPRYDGTAPVRTTAPPTTATATGSSVQVEFGSAWDEDNQRLTYRVYRDRGTSAEKLVATRTADSSFWSVPTLSVTDLGVPNGEHTYQVVVSDPFGNLLESPVSARVGVGTNFAPVARFTGVPDRLAVSFSGAGSTDEDGRVVSWSWAFGDGRTGTGETTTHTYAAAGSYPVTLTVTDDDGATATTRQTVVVTGEPKPLARDDFERTTASGWGPADLGGTWTTPSAGSLSTAGGTGLIRLAAGAGPYAQLATGSRDADLQLTFAVDKAPAASSLFVRAVPRGTVTDGYFAKVYAPAGGKMVLYLVRVQGNVQTTLKTFVLPEPLTAGKRWTVRTQAVGSGPTLVRARVWADGSAEPSTWQVSTTDATAALQTQTGIAVGGYASAGVTNAPLTLSVDKLLARPTSG